MHIRKYEEEDLSEFTELMSDLGSPATIDEMKKRIERIENNPNYYTFVAVKEGVLVGMIGITLHTTYTTNNMKVQITSLVTKQAYRSQGIAQALVKYVEDWSLNRGNDFIYLLSGISENRKKAHELYKFLGYDITGYRFVKHL